MKAARQTSQLARMPLTTVGPKADLHLPAATAAAILAVEPVSSPVYWKATTKSSEPIRLPAYVTTQLRTRSAVGMRPSYTAAAHAAVLPVKSWLPVATMLSSAIGNRPPKMSFVTPGLPSVSPGMLLATVSERTAAKAT